MVDADRQRSSVTKPRKKCRLAHWNSTSCKAAAHLLELATGEEVRGERLDTKEKQVKELYMPPGSLGPSGPNWPKKKWAHKIGPILFF